MNRRLKLPVVEAAEQATSAPTPETMRRALGGRLTEPLPADVGQVVSLEQHEERPVVILFADEHEAHVWVGQGRVRQVKRAALRPYAGAPTVEVAAIARDIARFAALGEGEPVAFLSRQPEGHCERGLLVEKCRFGALVLRADQSLLGVGFRRLWRDEPQLN